MNQGHFELIVPGSTANLGSGFDSIGLAINRYLKLNVKPSEEWVFHYPDGFEMLSDLENNLIYKVAEKVAKQYGRSCPCYDITVSSDIPLARGLGSSGAAIIAGIELANIGLDLQLKTEEKAKIACDLEGHPDNVTASLYGGLTISSYFDGELVTLTSSLPDVSLCTLIPEVELKTETARHVLPKSLLHSESVQASSICNVMIAALLQQNWTIAGQMMEKDLFHQPYRTSLIPDLPIITRAARELGAYGTFLSGAGPTIMSFVPHSQSQEIITHLQSEFPNYQCQVLSPVIHGLQIKK
ncbi:homoserine kinase [Terrilactibacillus laevilacticus]|uniref:Homoserine kinase n=1 Tax=Terrilactibacillus laevilacticus TaxID=1380157 RepID=A0ABW5PSG8_9BACI|nr:homoserine kinase [Terrilactibacillus laevilacticus]